MKVLFAVNDENISTSIVKKYQKQYKEIISYKNVYYFNAILKELQRNKSYDRVVISEDLEEFTSSSLEQKDKFIFDRLDNISDEAVASDGSDIPIILICSERRTKSEDILVKLFGIGIYNAIIGEDRSTEEVCRLINKPRSKKEAKIYYRIDSENVNYEKESESDVSEIEMQNILMHFKKLGKNEDRYVESFHNIVSQYNDAQLKVIIAVLPNNVKEVLAENSPEYQRIMYSGGRSNANKTMGTRNVPSKRVKNTTKGTSEKLLETETTPILARPVVVPTTMEKSMYTKVNTKKKIDIDLDELEDEEDFEENIKKVQKTEPKRRGRPRKNPLPVKEEPEEEEELINVLPGFEEEDDDDDLYEYDEETETINPSRSIKKNNNTSVLPGLEDYDEEDDDYEEEEYQDELEDEYNSYEDETENTFIPQREKQYNNTYRNEIYTGKTQEMKKYDNIFEEGEFESLLTGDKKVATFIGTSKNGTSFIVNNIAQILSNMGINTAILDATQNKNAYYIYTKNDEDLRRTAVDCFGNLMKGRAEGIKVNNNLTVYTSIPSQNEQINNSHPIIETLVRNHSLVLIDCDFTTPVEYFDKSQEIYLIQSMDVLTIQPLTEFLRELKIKNALGENKIRIILNKILRVKGVNGKNIVGGMSNYNDPEMSFMTELFDRNTVKIAGQLPFDEDVYAKYLENLIECEIKLNGYPKEFRTRLATLAEVIYPLLPNNNVDKKVKKKSKKENNQYSGSFSSGMNNTLDNMRKKY